MTNLPPPTHEMQVTATMHPCRVTYTGLYGGGGAIPATPDNLVDKVMGALITLGYPSRRILLVAPQDVVSALEAQGVGLDDDGYVGGKRGPGRPSAEKRDANHLTLPRSMWERLDAEADKLGVSRSQRVAQLIALGWDSERA